jgi:hypothetical protein
MKHRTGKKNKHLRPDGVVSILQLKL